MRPLPSGSALVALGILMALGLGACDRQGPKGATAGAAVTAATAASATVGGATVGGATVAAATVAAATAGGQGDPRLATALAALDKAAEEMGAAAAGAVRARMEASPKNFLDALDTVLAERALDPERFVRVDKVAPPLGSDFVPPDLVSLDGLLPVTRSALMLRRGAAGALAAMAKAAKADGVSLIAGSAYRSWNYQEAVFAREVKSYGEAAARRESAEPGRSQHQLGTALDFSPIDDVFGKSRAFAWLVAHARDFGFSRSYPEGMEALTGYRPESWHWRWIGLAASRIEWNYFGGIQQYLMEFLATYN